MKMMEAAKIAMVRRVSKRSLNDSIFILTDPATVPKNLTKTILRMMKEIIVLTTKSERR